MDMITLVGATVTGLCCLFTVVVVGGALVMVVLRAGTEDSKGG